MLVNKESRNTVEEINGEQLRRMLNTALMSLKEQKSFIDSLNVFPVPDGDTGTNMYLTFLEAVKEVRRTDSDRVDDINEALAKGALMGARGNSGVILSQLLRGFSLVNKDNRVIDAEHLVRSLTRASEVAYQGVLKPVEGTILTVSRRAAEGAEQALENELDITGIIQNTIEYARKALNNTPEQLPALKEAEVVDAGGQGYLTILEGMMAGLMRESIGRAENQVEYELIRSEKAAQQEEEREFSFNYCTELLINLQENQRTDIDQIRNDLQNYGDSLMVVGSDNVVKIHVHTNHPGIILEYALKLGALNNIKIDNMENQHRERLRKQEVPATENTEEKRAVDKQKGIIAVGKGEGIKNILQELGVDLVIDGGQSMNPSTNDFVEAINKLACDEIIILPNNKNIISAAEQAVSMSEKDIRVLHSKSIPDAISSLLVFNDQVELDGLQEAMEREMKQVKTAEITRAVKDSRINGMTIAEGDIIGIFEGNIRVKGNDYDEVVINLFTEVLDDEELITFYYGEEVTEEEAEVLIEKIKHEFAINEIEMYYGGQPLYPYIISLE